MCLQKCTLAVYITGKQQQTKRLICLFQFLTGTVVAADVYMQVKYFMASAGSSVAYVIMGTLFRSFLILPPSFAATSETCLLLSSSEFYCGVVLMPWQFNVLGEGIFIYIILQSWTGYQFFMYTFDVFSDSVLGTVCHGTELVGLNNSLLTDGSQTPAFPPTCLLTHLRQMLQTFIDHGKTFHTVLQLSWHVFVYIILPLSTVRVCS